MLLVEVDSGKVLHAENATYPWYPASLSKLMTAYVTLRAVKENRISLNSLMTMSELAHAQQPSKMGFKPGTQLTVDNGLKMLMVKSANDIAVALAEGISGSVENFAAEMNAAAQRLGMTQSNFVNPNGWPDARQVSSARDMAILARALLREFPEHNLYWHIPAIKFGRRVLRNYNKLIDRYPGADGMKTGFICASGFNLVATATRHGRRLIAVVLGAPSSPVRAEKAARLLESGFNNRGTLSWLTPSLGYVNALAPIAAAPPDLYDETCGKNRRRPAAESDDDDAHSNDPEAANGIHISSLQTPKPASLIGPLIRSMPPIVVTVGPPRTPAQALVVSPLPPARPAGKRTGTARLNQAAPTPVASVAPTPAGSAAIQSATFSHATLALNPPAGFAPSKRNDAVPLPRPRPRALARAKKRRQ
ncbi:MAG: peptidase M15 [Rhizobiales bacterium]|nr:peptidase M15 [Hyphomicrobiales bacterium]